MEDCRRKKPPTLLDMAQVQHRTTKQPVDGISFLPLLEGRDTNYHERALYWHFPNLWGEEGPGIGTTSTIRKGDWKMVYYYESGKKELFNIADDIGETKDLAPQKKPLVKQLSKELGTYLRGVDAQRPSFKADGRWCPWPDEV